jgi:hypothetical protein
MELQRAWTPPITAEPAAASGLLDERLFDRAAASRDALRPASLAPKSPGGPRQGEDGEAVAAAASDDDPRAVEGARPLRAHRPQTELPEPVPDGRPADAECLGHLLLRAALLDELLEDPRARSLPSPRAGPRATTPARAC